MPEHLNYYNGSMYDIVADVALKYPNLVALEFFYNKVTYKDFIKKVDKVAIALKELDVVENECVTICMCNIVHPLDKERDIKQSMNDVNSMVLFATDVFFQEIKNIVRKILLNMLFCINMSLGKAFL